MQSIEAYKRLLLKINKNDTNSDIDISKGEFVLLYKEQKDRWLQEKIGGKESTEDIQDLEEVQVKHFQLQSDILNDRYVAYILPDNFFSYISSYSFCSKENCNGVLISHYPFKPKNENMLLESANTEPSFEYEETVVDLSSGKLYVYKKDFEIDSTFANYYREVGEIDIEGYRRLDGTQSTNIDPDLSDVYVDEILNRCAKEIIRRYENPDGFALAEERVAKEK